MSELRNVEVLKRKLNKGPLSSDLVFSYSGKFHGFFTDPDSEIVALVEAEGGEIEQVDTRYIKFVKDAGSVATSFGFKGTLNNAEEELTFQAAEDYSEVEVKMAEGAVKMSNTEFIKFMAITLNPETAFCEYKEVTFQEAVEGIDSETSSAVELSEAPSNNLPTYKDCTIRVGNSDYFRKRQEGGGYGPEGDDFRKLANPLHEFIYEYDSSDAYKSKWFLHRLENALNFVKEEAIAGESLGKTPSSRWHENGEPDPHGHTEHYNGERARLCKGDLTDDEIANEVYMTPDIANLTAAKERIRWLSRALEKTLANVVKS